MDLSDGDKGNISLPSKLQSYDPATLRMEKEKKKKKSKLPTIYSLQKTFYDIKATDINKKIERFEVRNDELSMEIETAEETTTTLDANTAEEISNLTKQVVSQNNVLENLKSKIEDVEESRRKHKNSLEEAIKLFNQKYKEKKVELVSQIKVLNAKINVLEEFRKVQNVLGEKFTANEEKMVKNEQELKEMLEDFRRKNILDKEILKNDMYECLLALAAEFQLETSKHISLPNQRLLRENIILKKELQQISEIVSAKMNAQLQTGNLTTEHKKLMHSRFLTMKYNIILTNVQNEVLQRLKKRFGKTKQLHSSLYSPHPHSEEKYLMLIETACQEEDELNFYLATLKTLLHKTRAKCDISKYLLKKLECKIKVAVETIYDLKYAVTSLMKCPSRWKDLQKLSYTQLFLYLRDLLNKGQLKFDGHMVTSLESIPRELDSDQDLEKILAAFDLAAIKVLTEDPSIKETLTKIAFDKTNGISSEEEYVHDKADVSDNVSSHSLLSGSYHFYGEEFVGEFDSTDE